MHLGQNFLSGLILTLELPFLLVRRGNWSVALGAAWLLLDLVSIVWACRRWMRFVRTRTQWPEVLHGLPILVVAPLLYLATNGLVLLVFSGWPPLPH